MSTAGHTVSRRRPCELLQPDKHELCLYREAGVSISLLASMWHISPTGVRKILAAQGVAKKNLGRMRRRRMLGQRLKYAAPIKALARWLSAPRPGNETEVRP
jgi:hypothetical protein